MNVKCLSALTLCFFCNLISTCLKWFIMLENYQVHAVNLVINCCCAYAILMFRLQKLVDFLKAGKNVPTVLQSLGCIAQHSWVTFSAREEEIVSFICRKFLSPSEVSFHNLFILVKVTCIYGNGLDLKMLEI